MDAKKIDGFGRSPLYRRFSYNSCSGWELSSCRARTVLHDRHPNRDGWSHHDNNQLLYILSESAMIVSVFCPLSYASLKCR